MFTDMDAYLKYFDGICRRTARDVAALPAEAAQWRPPVIGDESGWSIGQIVSHIGSSRLYFASAYRGEGWVWDAWPNRLPARDTWEPALERAPQHVANETLLESLDQRREEALDHEPLGRVLGQAVGAQVEQLLRIDLRHRRGVGAPHVVGLDLQPGDRVGMGPL